MENSYIEDFQTFAEYALNDNVNLTGVPAYSGLTSFSINIHRKANEIIVKASSDENINHEDLQTKIFILGKAYVIKYCTIFPAPDQKLQKLTKQHFYSSSEI